RINSCLAVLSHFLLMPYPVVSSLVRAESRKPEAGGKKQSLLAHVGKIFGINDPAKLSTTSSLAELGIDSLMAVEMKQVLENEYDVVLSMQQQRLLTLKNLKEIETAQQQHGSMARNGSNNKESGLVPLECTFTFDALPSTLSVQLNNALCQSAAPVYF